MLAAVYVLVLGCASGLVGLWGRRLLLDMGIVSGFDAGLWICACAAAVYAGSQLSFRAALQFIMPSRALSLHVTEILSHCSAFLLLPALLGFTIPLPVASLMRFEPFIHLGVFAGAHGLFKLMAFFAAVQGERASRLRAFPYALLALATCLAGYAATLRYLDAVTPDRPFLLVEPTPFAVDNMYTMASALPENRRLIAPLHTSEGQTLTLFMAPQPDETPFPANAYLLVETYARHFESGSMSAPPSARFVRTLSLQEAGWTAVSLERSALPEGTQCLTLTWSFQDPEDLRLRLGLKHPEVSDKIMMVSGPWPLGNADPAAGRSMVVILAEGMGAENMSLYGYGRNTTPQLAERASTMVRYESAYTPVPEAGGATMSLLTGLNPLAHGYFEEHAGPLPEGAIVLAEALRDRQYLTLAFTEGRGLDRNDMVYGSGFERGFVLFNDHFPIEARASRSSESVGPERAIPAGAGVTLNLAANWVEANAAFRYLVFIRLRELRNPQPLRRYGTGFMGQGRTPTPMDVYDTAMTTMDSALAAFLDRTSALPETQRPLVVITSSNGFDFSEPGRGAWRRGGVPKRNLSESALRVPLLVWAPDLSGQTRTMPVSLEDLAPSLATLAGATLPHSMDGQDIFSSSPVREIRSMAGDPIAISTRAGRWRFTWQSGLSPYTLEPAGEETVIAFLDVNRHREDLAPQNNLGLEPELASAFRSQLQEFLFHYAAKNTTP